MTLTRSRCVVPLLVTVQIALVEDVSVALCRYSSRSIYSSKLLLICFFLVNDCLNFAAALILVVP